MRSYVNAFIRCGALVAALFAIGCEAPGVGDPCIPEAIPEGGFNGSEPYIETSSAQCRTRVCLVYQLQGDPGKIQGTASCPSGDPTCVPQSEVDDRVYCSCRCGDRLCDCGDGFSCQQVLQEVGGAVISGSYCVKNGTTREDT